MDWSELEKLNTVDLTLKKKRIYLKDLDLHRKIGVNYTDDFGEFSQLVLIEVNKLITVLNKLLLKLKENRISNINNVRNSIGISDLKILRLIKKFSR